MAYIVKYQDVWKHEIIKHFGNPAKCSRMCHVQRSNLYRSFIPSDGYISELMLLDICRQMDLSPLCFLDDTDNDRFHNYCYSEKYKMSFSEYEALSYRMKRVNGSLIDHTLKIYAGLSDQQLQQLDDTVKLRLQLTITREINKTLAESLPTWS